MPYFSTNGPFATNGMGDIIEYGAPVVANPTVKKRARAGMGAACCASCAPVSMGDVQASALTSIPITFTGGSPPGNTGIVPPLYPSSTAAGPSPMMGMLLIGGLGVGAFLLIRKLRRQNPRNR